MNNDWRLLRFLLSSYGRNSIPELMASTLNTAETPLIGSEEPVWVLPVSMDLSFFGGPPNAIIPVESEEHGIFQMQPRCWWQPIEDEE